MQQTTMLAIFAIVLALGLTTAMFVMPIMPKVFAQGFLNKFKACDHKGAGHIPFCIV